MIDSFNGDFDFLSNFYGKNRTVEHYYQAAKTLDPGWQTEIINAETPGRAKRIGQKAPLREDWDDIKVNVMLTFLREKFKDQKLKIKLIDTHPHSLVEGNTWHDNFWGICSCPKCHNKESNNMLGYLLAKVRAEIMAEMKK